MFRRCTLPLAVWLVCTGYGVARQDNGAAPLPTVKPNQSEKKAQASKQNAAKPLSPAEELQKAIADAGNDRAAMVKNLKGYLDKFPDAPERPQIYRALVEACVQFKDEACATDYAERIVALTPDDTSMTLLAVQLLEQNGDQAGLRRAETYVTRVYDSVKNAPLSDKSPKVSAEDWEGEKRRDESALLTLRGRLEGKTNDAAAARKDFEQSYALQPNASAALKLGELDELAKNYDAAATEYARAFALAESSNRSGSRRDIRQKLGNAWRLAHHGSEAGLGDFLLKAIDEVTTSAAAAQRAKRNDGVKDLFAFTLRRVPEGTAYPVSAQKGKVLVINFWATWCGPCHALEPIYEKMAVRYATDPGLVFLSVNCDEDESLVGPYLAEKHPHATEVFADRLDEFFGVESFPTLLILDASGKVAFRANGFDPDTIEKDLSAAIGRVAGGGGNAEKAAAANN